VANLRTALDASGATIRDVLKTTVFVASSDEIRFLQVRARPQMRRHRLPALLAGQIPLRAVAPFARLSAPAVRLAALAEHLITLARILGGDGAMPLFSQASVSRVICEAAIRFAWLMDPDVTSATRLLRGAVALHHSAEERSKGVRAIPAGHFAPSDYQQMLGNCSQERDDIRKLPGGAGMTFGSSAKGNTKSRLELQSQKTAIPLKINIIELMAAWLPDSPSWYNIGFAVTHSIYWGLRDITHSRPGQALALTPEVLDVGAAVVSAISASALILDRRGRMNGHDPAPHVRRALERRDEIDALMQRAVTSNWLRISR
jgi:enamine deaminase RidA (YjgF/YER057c/UK114 family)